eukprot:3953924-Amphidinium_carterae.1
MHVREDYAHSKDISARVDETPTEISDPSNPCQLQCSVCVRVCLYWRWEANLCKDRCVCRAC